MLPSLLTRAGRRLAVRCCSFQPLTVDQQRLLRPRRRPAASTKPPSSPPPSIVASALRVPSPSSPASPALAAPSPALPELAADVARLDADLAQLRVPPLAPAARRCGGCGCGLQAKSPEEQGFIPAAALVARGRSGGLLCLRCRLLRAEAPGELAGPGPGNDAFEVVLDAVARLPAATLVLVVDLGDLEAGLPPALGARLAGHDVVLVGAKADQLSPDGPGAVDRWSRALRDAAVERAGVDPRRVRDVLLVSARTGYGVERLVDALARRALQQQPVYLVGTAGAGKSELFNRLLWSDLGKAPARRHVPRATVSLWPGTTVSTLKFPIVTMTPERRDKRMERLASRIGIADKKVRRRLWRSGAPLQGSVGLSFEDPAIIHNQHQGLGRLPTFAWEEGQLEASEYDEKTVIKRFMTRAHYDEKQYHQARWLYDTPGYMHPGQLQHLLSHEELLVLRGSHCRLRLLPRSVSVRVGMSLLLGGVAQLDVVSGPWPALLTALTNLSLHVVPTPRADEYRRRFAAHLGVPAVSRRSPLPPLAPTDVALGADEGAGEVATADVVFAGAGWVTVTTSPPSGSPGDFLLRAHFPEGLLCAVRRPPLLPLAGFMRGKRIPGTCEYRLPPELRRHRRAPAPTLVDREEGEWE